MDEVERVVLWVGLASGIVGITLSAVAIWFAVRVNDRAEASQTRLVEAVTKIEGAVDRISEDVRGMVREGFLRMLPAGDHAEGSEEAVTEGLVAEANEQIDELEGQDEQGSDLSQPPAADESPVSDSDERPSERYVQRVQRMVRSPNEAMKVLDSASFEAQELVRQLVEGGTHLTLQQYKALGGTARRALDELRRHGMIVPLAGWGSDGRRLPVYYFPPAIADAMPGLVRLLPPAPRSVRDLIKFGMSEVNYPPSLYDPPDWDDGPEDAPTGD